MGCCSSNEEEGPQKEYRARRNTEDKKPKVKATPILYEDGKKVSLFEAEQPDFSANSPQKSKRKATVPDDTNRGATNGEQGTNGEVPAKTSAKQADSAIMETEKTEEQKVVVDFKVSDKGETIAVKKWKRNGGGRLFGGSYNLLFLRLYENDLYYGPKKAAIMNDEVLEMVKIKIDKPDKKGKLRDKKTQIVMIPHKRVWETKKFGDDGIEINSMHSYNSANKLDLYRFLVVEKKDVPVLHGLLHTVTISTKN